MAVFDWVARFASRPKILIWLQDEIRPDELIKFLPIFRIHQLMTNCLILLADVTLFVTDYAVLLPWKHHAWKWQSVSQVGSEWVFYEKFARYWDSRTELHPNTECIKLQNNSTLSYIQKINYYFPGLTQNNYLDIH